MRNRALWNNRLTDAVILEAAERHQLSLDNPGFCLECGAEAEGVEQDARGYECEHCGAAQVYGAEELMLCIA